VQARRGARQVALGRDRREIEQVAVIETVLVHPRSSIKKNELSSIIDF
jgi:hypothetical protein